MSNLKEKILIADDMETFLRLEKMLLERSGYEIIMAKSGGEAIKKIQQEKPSLIFIDLVMPDMNGDAVCRFVKTNKALKEIPVIMVTTKSDPESKNRCLQAGCNDFVTKPVTQRDLYEKIKKFLQVERRGSDRATLRVTVITTGKSFTFNDFLCDVSEGGVFVETESPIAAGAQLQLEFTLPSEEKPINAIGKVVHTVAPGPTAKNKTLGMGISFVDILAVDSEKIKKYVNGKK
jgi:two-component system, OmpR family, alkaline phosphatase synthesis response regulator PhoP